jgi:hypothetical protein
VPKAQVGTKKRASALIEVTSGNTKTVRFLPGGRVVISLVCRISGTKPQEKQSWREKKRKICRRFVIRGGLMPEKSFSSTRPDRA